MHSLLQTSALAVLVAGRLPAARASAADASSAVDSALLVGPHAVNPELDCLLRSLAWEYGQHLGSLPGASPAMLPPFRTLFDALRLSADCGLTPPPPEPRGAGPTVAPRSAARAAATYYADPVHGSDSNAGTLSSPFLTVGRALAASRAGPAPASIVLRGGTFFVPETLELLPADSGLSIAAFPGESATLSGGLPLSNLTWTRADVPPSPPLSPPTTGSLLAWNGSSCVKNPGESHPGVCVPLGTTPDAPACAALCLASGATQANASCTGYTWHDNTTGPWHGWCYGREDGYNHVDGEPGHVSAWRLEPVELWSTVLPAGMPLFDQLFYGASGVRAVRARWPNSNPEIDISPNGYTSASSWLPPAAFPPPVEFHPRSPNRSAYDPFFPSFQWGVNGTVGNFTTGSFWGTTHPPAGDQYRVPSGVVLPPNAPPNASSWDTSGAVLHAFHCGGWGDWAFIIDASTGPPADVNGTLVFSRGGWQEARGCATGGGFFVENIPQLVDAAGEWHYDAETRTLLAAFNASTPPSNTSASSPQYITSHLATILSVSGTSSDPVRAVTLGPNLTFAHTLADFEEPYTVPSGGDWSFCASAAVVISGTEATVVQGCTFTRDGGNGILVSGYNRGVEILGSEFSYTGASGIVIAGLNGSAVTAGAPDFPEGTLVAGNLGREVGVYVKQSGFLYSALSANNTVSSNVFFNGPRAGININDGFAGGHNVTGNLGLNFVRETADHGCVGGRTGCISRHRLCSALMSSLQCAKHVGSRALLMAALECVRT